MTQDPEILDTVEHCHTDLDLPENLELNSRIQYNFNTQEQKIIDTAISKLLKMGVIKAVDPCNGQILSPIFLRPKKNGECRMVLNLKSVNNYAPYKHFKMETFEKALTLINRGMYMASVDLRHAYYSVKIAEEQQKFFRFIWQNQIYQYTCLANGVSEGPRIFTKLLKPVYAKLRYLGYINSCFIDDSILCGQTMVECEKNVTNTVSVMTQVGFLINWDKSVLIPTTTLLYLGNIINSLDMTVTLPKSRKDSITIACKKLRNKKSATIREVAKLTGLIVASFSAVEYGKLHYQNLEKAKISALKQSKGYYDSVMAITDNVHCELDW